MLIHPWNFVQSIQPPFKLPSAERSPFSKKTKFRGEKEQNQCSETGLGMEGEKKCVILTNSLVFPQFMLTVNGPPLDVYLVFLWAQILRSRNLNILLAFLSSSDLRWVFSKKTEFREEKEQNLCLESGLRMEGDKKLVTLKPTWQLLIWLSQPQLKTLCLADPGKARGLSSNTAVH